MSNKTAKEMKHDGYTIQIRYSDEARKKKLMKFISKSGDEFVISSDEMISILMEQVNTKTLSPTFVEIDKVNVVEVGRQLVCVLDKDMKKGEEIRINYTHPYPIEFALIEEAYKIAVIKQDVKVFEITTEYLDKVKDQIGPDQEEYIEKFYKSFKNVQLKK